SERARASSISSPISVSIKTLYFREYNWLAGVCDMDDAGQSHLKSGRLEGSQYVKEERKKKMEGITLQEHFATLEDPRVERTKHHQLLAIMTIALCAVICGADTWVDIEEFGHAKPAWLETFLELPDGIPEHD